MAAPDPGPAPHTHSIDWADTSALTLDDIFINLATPAPSVAGASPRPAPRPLACARCHAQKLRCVRQRQHGRACNRCLSAGAECVARQPQRMGRPAETSPRARRRRATAAEAHAPTPQSPPQHGAGGREESGARRESTPDCTMPLPRGGPLFGSRSSTDLMEQWDWQNLGRGPSNADPRNVNTRLREDSTASGSTLHVNTGSSASSLSTTPPVPYGGPLVAGIRGLNSLLPDFDDMPCHLFAPDQGLAIPGTPAESPAPAPLCTDTARARVSSTDTTPPDPVEQLTKLHLDLYQCLNIVRVVETYKRSSPPSSAEPPKTPTDIDTTWIETLFEAVERFITTLRTHTGAINPCRDEGAVAKARGGDDEASAAGDRPSPAPVELDTATGLMIVSCYTRLLQTLEVVVALVPVYRGAAGGGCPGDMVQVRFGGFCPSADRALHVRLVLQYVLHLVEGASRAVDGAVACRPLSARALADLRGVEAKLREAVEVGLH